MKYPPVYCALLFFCLFAACKKDAKTNIIPIKVNHPALLTDSVSFSIAGKTYALNTVTGSAIGDGQANVKVDSSIYYAHISSDKDSVFFWRSYKIENDTSTAQVSFFKKYSKTDLSAGILNIPVSVTDLFLPGNYPFAVDYTRENAHNGVAIAVNGIGQSYSTKDVLTPVGIKQASENGSALTITSLTKMPNGLYLVEAKFNAILFDSNENPIKLEDGYLRLNLNLN